MTQPDHAGILMQRFQPRERVEDTALLTGTDMWV